MKYFIVLFSLFLLNPSFCNAQNFESEITELENIYNRREYNLLIEKASIIMLNYDGYQEPLTLMGLAYLKMGNVENAIYYLSLAKDASCKTNKFCLNTLEDALKIVELRNIKTKEAKEYTRQENLPKAISAYWECYSADSIVNEECGIQLLELLIKNKKLIMASVLCNSLVNSPNEAVSESVKRVNFKLNNYPEVKGFKEYPSLIQNADDYYINKDFNNALFYYEKALLAYPETPQKMELETIIHTLKDEIAFEKALRSKKIEDYEFYYNTFFYGNYISDVKDFLKKEYISYATYYKSSNNFNYARNYYNKYIEKFKYDNNLITENILNELCNLDYLEGKIHLKERYFGGAYNSLNKAYQCNHPNVSKGMLRRIKFREKNNLRKNYSYLGINSEIEYLPLGLYFGSSNKRKIGFYYNYRIPGLMKLSGSYFETNNQNEVIGTTSSYSYTSATAYKYFIASLGITKRIIYPLDFHLGLGFINAVEYKEFRDNSYDELVWAKNTENNQTEPLADFGLHLMLKPLVLSYGISYPLNKVGGATYYPHFGIGFML